MNLSRKKRRWVSIGVGIIGLVTIVGLSDLLFLIPREQSIPTPTVESEIATTTIPTTSNEINVPLSIPTTTTSTPKTGDEFTL